jgi:hypothetical protein
MTEQPPPSSENLNANEANLAMRKAHREANTQAGRLADRLSEIDVHQREARYLLERAGLLRRRNGP